MISEPVQIRAIDAIFGVKYLLDSEPVQLLKMLRSGIVVLVSPYDPGGNAYGWCEVSPDTLLEVV